MIPEYVRNYPETEAWLLSMGYQYETKGDDYEQMCNLEIPA